MKSPPIVAPTMASRVAAIALRSVRPVVALLPIMVAAGCASVSLDQPGRSDDTRAARLAQAGIAPELQVPAGSRLVAQTVGVGRMQYECRSGVDARGAGRWVFTGWDAVLKDRSGRRVGRYLGAPGVWELDSGARVSGRSVAAELPRAGTLPQALFRVDTHPEQGASAGPSITHVQQVATRGGLPRSPDCGTEQIGRRDAIDFQADYNFWQ